MAPLSVTRRLSLTLLILVTANLTVRPASAAPKTQAGEIMLLPGTVDLEPNLADALTAALHEAGPLVAEVPYFAATDLQVADGWAVASMVGLKSVGANQSWHAEDGSWFGLALAHQSEPDVWEAALAGTTLYSTLLAQVPSSVLNSTEAPALGDSLFLGDLDSTIIFPWQSGTAMLYGPLGIHDGGSGWKAVDVATDFKTSIGHSAGIAVAATSGAVDYVCKDGISVTIRLGGFLYAHLLDNPGLYAGRHFAQGDELGQLKAGSFNSMCGSASQPSNWAHLHWAFPNGDLMVEDWTLSMSSGLWKHEGATIAPGSGWITAPPKTVVGSTQLFDDVPVAGKDWMQPWVEEFYYDGITTGCGASPLIYCPEAPVTRAAMAVFILRAEHGPSYVPPPADHYFADLPVTGKEWMEPWVDQYYREGLTTGCAASPLRYCPDNPVTRAAMAVFLLRAREGPSYVPPAADHFFADLPATGKEWMEPFVDEFYRRGITTGCGASPLTYCPESPVTRASMAVFIERAFDMMP